MHVSVLHVFSIAVVQYFIACLEVNQIIELGKEIEEEINEMTGNKQEIKLNLETYRNYLKQLLRLLKRNSPKGKKIYAAMEEIVGPPHISIPIYNVLNKHVYNWTRKEASKLEGVIDDTIDAWNEIESIIANNTNWQVEVKNEDLADPCTMVNLTLDCVGNRNISMSVLDNRCGDFNTC
uniref:Secreted protein n=1 Tax=Clastoptera arizonana TaxID=38151 RepID=A0A1B6D8V3_9HEMI